MWSGVFVRRTRISSLQGNRGKLQNRRKLVVCCWIFLSFLPIKCSWPFDLQLWRGPSVRDGLSRKTKPLFRVSWKKNADIGESRSARYSAKVDKIIWYFWFYTNIIYRIYLQYFLIYFKSCKIHTHINCNLYMYKASTKEPA